jgi:hypothetical protein
MYTRSLLCHTEASNDMLISCTTHTEWSTDRLNVVHELIYLWDSFLSLILVSMAHEREISEGG